MNTHQNGSVTRRGSKWVIRWRVMTGDGKRKHRAETVEGSKADAKRKLAERVRLANAGTIEPALITFAEFVEHQWASYTHQQWKQSTQRTGGCFVQKHIVPFFGKYKLAAISPALVLEFIQQASKPRNVGTEAWPVWKPGLSQKTIGNLYGLLTTMFNLAVQLDLIVANPVKKVDPPRVERQEKPMLTLQQVRALINETPTRYRALPTLLVLTGLRIGEALGLKWRDVDLQNKRLYVRRTLWEGQVQSTKTKASERTKKIGPVLLKALQVHREMSIYTTHDDYVFANDAGRPFNQNWLRVSVLYSAMDKAGIDRETARAFGFHLLRHTAGSIVYAKTRDLKKAQRFLGHSNVMTTSEVYVHLMVDAEDETVEALEEAVFAQENGKPGDGRDAANSTEPTTLPETSLPMFSNVRKSTADVN